MRPLSTIRRIAGLAAPLRDAGLRLSRDERGATMIEYSLMTAIMAVSVVACMRIFSTAMGNMFDLIVGYYTLAE